MRTNWPPVIARAAAIADEYDARIGAPLTLRQLFYRLVAEQLIPNRQTAYQRLATLTANERRRGAFPGLADHTRGVNTFTSWPSAAAALAWLADAYRGDRTAGQPATVVLGVEKRGMVEQLGATGPVGPVGVVRRPGPAGRRRRRVRVTTAVRRDPPPRGRPPSTRRAAVRR